MAQKRKIDQSQIILEAALAHADKVGWEALTFRDIAKKAKIKEDQVAQHYADIWDILGAVLAQLDKRTLEMASERLGEEARDNLFEMMMTRFDLIEEHRGAFISLLHPRAMPPQKWAVVGRQFIKSMQGMIDHAGYRYPAPVGGVLMGGLYLSVLRSWRNDDTPDLSKTMAAIDKHLDKLEKVFACGARA